MQSEGKQFASNSHARKVASDLLAAEDVDSGHACVLEQHFFFAPRAVRPNSPVTIEQKKDHSPFQATHIDRSRSGRLHCSPARNAVLIQPRNKKRSKQQDPHSGLSQLYKNPLKSKSRPATAGY